MQKRSCDVTCPPILPNVDFSSANKYLKDKLLHSKITEQNTLTVRQLRSIIIKHVTNMVQPDWLEAFKESVGNNEIKYSQNIW